MTKCCICKAPYERRYLSQKTCGDPICKGEQKRQEALKKAARAELKARKEKVKKLSEIADEAQTAFNALRRYEDLQAGYGCISCGTHNPVQWHGGHYRTVKAAKQHRFNPDNVHLQCSQCNNHDSGNIVEYRINLVKRIGLERVEAIEHDNRTKRWTKEELIQIRDHYRSELRKLKKEAA